jgi:hypothetical protein
MSYHEKPEFGGQKGHRLYYATRKGGIVKVSEDGSLVWVHEVKPSTLVRDGHIFDAQDFQYRAANALQIEPAQVFALDDDQIRDIARHLAGIEPLSLAAARTEAADATH